VSGLLGTFTVYSKIVRKIVFFFTLESGKILVIKEENISERKKMYSILRAEELAFARTPFRKRDVL